MDFGELWQQWNHFFKNNLKMGFSCVSLLLMLFLKSSKKVFFPEGNDAVGMGIDKGKWGGWKEAGWGDLLQEQSFSDIHVYGRYPMGVYLNPGKEREIIKI